MRRHGESLLKRVLVCNDGNVLELDVHCSCTNCQCIKYHYLIHFKVSCEFHLKKDFSFKKVIFFIKHKKMSCFRLIFKGSKYICE